MAEKFHVFVDHSNIWIEGKKLSGRLRRPPVQQNSRYRLDYERLLHHLLHGRRLAGVLAVYGSVPENKSVWDAFRSQGFRVKVLPLNAFKREKGVDMRMGLDIARLIYTSPQPGTIAMVAGDADFVPVVRDARARGWKVEVWWWSTAAVDLRSEADRFEALDGALYEVGFDE